MLFLTSSTITYPTIFDQFMLTMQHSYGRTIHMSTMSSSGPAALTLHRKWSTRRHGSPDGSAMAGAWWGLDHQIR